MGFKHYCIACGAIFAMMQQRQSLGIQKHTSITLKGKPWGFCIKLETFFLWKSTAWRLNQYVCRLRPAWPYHMAISALGEFLLFKGFQTAAVLLAINQNQIVSVNLLNITNITSKCVFPMTVFIAQARCRLVFKTVLILRSFLSDKTILFWNQNVTYQL